MLYIYIWLYISGYILHLLWFLPVCERQSEEVLCRCHQSFIVNGAFHLTLRYHDNNAEFTVLHTASIESNPHRDPETQCGYLQRCRHPFFHTNVYRRAVNVLLKSTWLLKTKHFAWSFGRTLGDCGALLMRMTSTGNRPVYGLSVSMFAVY